MTFVKPERTILLVDDMRNFPEVHKLLPGDRTFLARTYDEAVLYISNCRWSVIYLDHDLGDFRDGKERTGYDVLCMLEALVHSDPSMLPDKIECVSSNPSGRGKMQQVIDKMYGRNR